MFLPADVSEYNTRDYWENRFSKEHEYDWLCSYDSFSSILEEELKHDDMILVLGCGNSSLSERMYEAGYKNITNIDYSQNVISNMKVKYSKYSEMRWLTMDIMEMDFKDVKFDKIIEKATLDSFLVSEKDPWRLSPSAYSTMDRILSQVSSLLKEGGKFISITWAQPHFRKRILASPNYHWGITTATFGGFKFFVYIMTNGESLSSEDLELATKIYESPKEHTDYLPLETSEEAEEQLLSIDIS